ncbi:MAG: tetratricopeptide repeat protein [Planctomycetes bacterium]|nr:tetratricopeptide repeat protein [Planctomycetota bacterium]
MRTRRLLFRALMLRAAVHIHQSRYTEAEVSLARLVAMGPGQVGVYRHALALGNLAIVHREIGRVAQAESEYIEAAQVFGAMGRSDDEGRNLGNLANVLRDRGELETAEAEYQRALALVRAGRDPMSEGTILGNHAECLLLLGRKAEAEQAARDAAAVLDRIGDLCGLAQTLAISARIRAEQLDVIGAIELCADAVERLERVESPILAAIARAHLSRMLHQAGQLKEALVQSERSVQVLAAIGADETLHCLALPVYICAALAGTPDEVSRRSLLARLAECEAKLQELGFGPRSQSAQLIAECNRRAYPTEVSP